MCILCGLGLIMALTSIIDKCWTRPRACLSRLYARKEEQLDRLLARLWVAKEPGTNRMLVVTQNHSLLHAE